jgi:hypothetical protein
MTILRISGQKIIKLSNDRLDSLLMTKFVIFTIILVGTEDIHITGITSVKNERYLQKVAEGI